jgi:hypothetical protein|tara:strand:+ start:303 stop:803 length:501 start_codon:yes stop_codon:yes gene_type:complete
MIANDCEWFRMIANGFDSIYSQLAMYTEALGTKEELMSCIKICQSMHAVFNVPSGIYPPCDLNPLHLICTCKGFRKTSICSHIVAVTVFQEDEDGYDEAYLDSLLKKLCEKPKRASHRPNAVVGGARIQPHGDSDSDSDEEAMPAGTKWTEAHGEFFHEDSADDDE